MADSVEIQERGGLGLATLMAGKAIDRAALGARLGLDLAAGAKLSKAGALSLVGVGHEVWLAVQEDARPEWARGLAEAVKGLAWVSDQSSGYRVLRFSGPGAGALLQKGVYIDLDPDAFPVGSAAVTAIAHIGVTLWKVDADRFDLALFRSYAGSFSHWIESAGGPDFHFS